MKNTYVPQTPRLKRLASLLMIGGLSAVLLAGCGEKPKVQENEAKQLRKAGTEKLLVLGAEEARRAGIRVQQLALREKAEQIVVTATIQANQDKSAHIGPRVAGRIVKVQAKLGDRVKPGQVLAVLDSIELGEAVSTHRQASSEAALTQANFERAVGLYADNIIPEKEYLKARAEREKSLARLRASADRLRMLGLAPDRAAGSVFPLTTPFAGTVIEKKAVLGELAQPDQSLFTIADLSVLWIEANLFEKDLGRVRVGARASVTVSAYPGEVFKGKLTYISSVMDPGTRTVKARVEVPNPDGRLKPNMFAAAAIQTGTSSKALLLPEDAILLMQGQPTVFVEKDGGFEPRPVAVGKRFQGLAVIRSGVMPGETVVVSGAYALKARLLKSQIGDSD